ncbi:MAG: 1-deoxy-D-xylulose-5-phosphate synthase [Candidatus Alcyoniella australis]|nr:1-deoxy-D-xylulose-5-phosphate synthase [Candidatus Alcyoniella australis]
MNLLERIKSPRELKLIPEERLPELAEEIRELIVQTVSRTGGHLASNLGVVELTLAIHYVFDAPHDRLIWDVGHQAYTHKLLTGRAERFGTLRKHDGLSGFPHRDESEYDLFTVGHSGTSISVGLGLNEALKLAGRGEDVVSVIGDGSMTAGLAFEGLNQAGHLGRRIIIVLNDNEMSISPNVGALQSYISRKMSGPFYTRIRRRLKAMLKNIPAIGDDVFHISKKLEDSFKGFMTPGLLFEALGFEYFGPIDGHNTHDLIETFRNVRHLDNPVLVHAVTRKGKGYAPAEADPARYHGIGPFDPANGEPRSKPGPPSYTQVFSDAICELGARDERIVAITAAMPQGTGLELFSQRFPRRTYDVGIAEQHGICFAAGLARAGLRPVAAIYSTFLQRAYDQVVHDVCLQNLPVVFAVDRGGLVGADGPTHHGAFDLSYLRHIPNITLMAPKDEEELRHMLYTALQHEGPVALRYPRGAGMGVKPSAQFKALPIGRGEWLRRGQDAGIVALGPRAHQALAVAERLAEQNVDCAVFNARFVKPLDSDAICELARSTGRLVTLEDNALAGGFGSAVLELLADQGLCNVRVTRLGIPDRFIAHGDGEQLALDCGLDDEHLLNAVLELVERPRDKARRDSSTGNNVA